LTRTKANMPVSVFGPTKQPRLAINYRNQVQVDGAGRIHLTTSDDYQCSVRDPTWRAVQKYIKDVKDRNIRIVFFSATPQGGGVALMRHALLRFLTREGVRIEWYVLVCIRYAFPRSLTFPGSYQSRDLMYFESPKPTTISFKVLLALMYAVQTNSFKKSKIGSSTMQNAIGSQIRDLSEPQPREGLMSLLWMTPKCQS